MICTPRFFGLVTYLFDRFGAAIWGGVRLADLLKMQGIPYRTLEAGTGGRYVEFISVDYMKVLEELCWSGENCLLYKDLIFCVN